MDKSLDGIKKLSPEDIKKYRKIVLNYIGEKDTARAGEKPAAQGSAPLRKMDGIIFNKISSLRRQNSVELKKLSIGEGFLSGPSNPSAGGLTGKKEKPVRTNFLDNDRLKEAIRRQAEERRRIKEEERQRQLKKEQVEKDQLEQAEKQEQEKIRLEEERVRQEKIKQKEIGRAEAVKKWEEKMRLKEREKEEKRRIGENIKLKKEKVRQEKIRQMEIDKRERETAEKKRLEQAEIARREELKKAEIAEQVKCQAEETEKAEETKRWQEKIKLKELADEEKRRIKENLRLEKMKRQEEIKRIKRENKIKKRAEREKIRFKRRWAWRKFKKNFNLEAAEFYSVIRRNIIYIISLAALVLAIIYLIFCIAALRFKIDNNLISQILNYLPVPAVITNQGVISYNDFQNIENKNYLGFNLSEKKKYLASWLVRRRLIQKYGLPVSAPADDLAVKFVLDRDFNQVGLYRMEKISDLLKGQDSFEQLGKYADEYNNGVYYNLGQAGEKFGSAAGELAVDQISQIIPRADGYYILKRINDKDNLLGIKYLFIKARTLDQHVAEKSEKIKAFVLAD